MGTLQEYFKPVVNASKTIFEGMVVTFANMLRRPITIQYPDKTPVPVKEQLPPRYRGFLEVDLERCTACRLCMNACPIGCIQIDVEKRDKQRGMTVFDIDIGKCMYCGLCVEPCPTGCIVFTPEFEGSVFDVDSLVMRFIPEGEFVLPAKAKQAAEIPQKPRGSIVRQLLEKMKQENPKEKEAATKNYHPWR